MTQTFYLRYAPPDAARVVPTKPAGFLGTYDFGNTGFAGSGARHLRDVASAGPEFGIGSPLFDFVNGRKYATSQFITSGLLAQAVGAGNWVVAFAATLSGGGSSWVYDAIASLYLVNGATGAIRTTIFSQEVIGVASRTTMGAFRTAYETTVAGAAFNPVLGDYLALELSCTVSNVGVGQPYYSTTFDGPNAITADDVAEAHPRSLLTAPANLAMVWLDKAASDSGTFSATESAAVVPTFIKTASDGGTFSATETATVSVTSTPISGFAPGNAPLIGVDATADELATGPGMWYRWFPANGDPPITMRWDTPIRMTSSDGLLHAGSAIVDVKAPGQYGATLLDVNLAPRTVSFSVACEAGSMTERLALRKQLARAFLTVPRRGTAVVPQGVLRAYRNVDPTVEGAVYQPVVDLFGVAVASPQIQQFGPLALTADIELYCPYPFWLDVRQTDIFLQTTGGFQWPVQFPLTMASFNITREIDNTGDVYAPILMRFHGDCTTARLRNLTTGEQLEVSGNIPAGQYVEIQTEFGQKAITAVDGAGVRTNAMGRLNLAKADFWWLQPGINVVAFEASSNPSGRGEVVWRPRYAGV